MSKRHRMGQHFLKSQKIAQDIVDTACITHNDVVLEVGTGKGIVTKLLYQNAKNVTSVESDSELYHAAVHGIKSDNLELVCGDGFKTKDVFTVFVSNLPYSQSKKAIEWLAQRDFDRAVIMVQKEFAEKLTTRIRTHRRAISVIAEYSFKIEQVMRVKKSNFDPPPKVDSVVLKLEKKGTLDESMIDIINKMFSYRRKTLQNIFRQFGQDVAEQKRLDDLTGDEIVEIAKKIS